MIIGHSNISEYKKFIGNPDNAALKDRIFEVEVPCTLRMTEEAMIYKKTMGGDLKRPIAPKTLELLAKFAVMSRLSSEDKVAKYAPDVRAILYDGHDPEGPKSSTPTIDDLCKAGPKDEGMFGISTRFASKALSATFNARANEGEIGADPILLFEVLGAEIKREKTLSQADKDRYLGLLEKHIVPEYAQFIKEEITMAFTGANDQMCQAMFDRYILMARAWVMNDQFNNKGMSGKILSREELEKKLMEIEKPGGMVNGKDLRNEVTLYVMAKNAEGTIVRWNSYEKMASVIRQNLQKKMKDVMPVIKFDATGDAETAEKREQFIANMTAKGYTLPMIKRVVHVYERTLG